MILKTSPPAPVPQVEEAPCPVLPGSHCAKPCVPGGSLRAGWAPARHTHAAPHACLPSTALGTLADLGSLNGNKESFGVLSAGSTPRPHTGCAALISAPRAACRQTCAASLSPKDIGHTRSAGRNSSKPGRQKKNQWGGRPPRKGTVCAAPPLPSHPPSSFSASCSRLARCPCPPVSSMLWSRTSEGPGQSLPIFPPAD